MFFYLPRRQRHVVLTTLLGLTFAALTTIANAQADAELIKRARQANDRFALPEARALIEPLVARHPQDEGAMLEHARLLYFEGKYDEAWHQIRALLELHPNNAAAHNLRALVNLEWSKDVNAAFADINLAIQHDPTFVKAYINRARILALMEKPKEALADIDRALQRDPTSAGALLYRGLILHKLNQPAEALEAFSKTLEVAPDNMTRDFSAPSWSGPGWTKPTASRASPP